MELTVREHRGVAAGALGVIAAVTVAWWALALYPAGGAAPEWLLRTRMACFGAAPGGLPNAGGWVLLIGEPIGMLGVLGIAWGGSLATDLRWLMARDWGRAMMAACVAALVFGAIQATRVVHTAMAAGNRSEAFDVASAGTGGTTTIPVVPPLTLVDQGGGAFDLSQLTGRPVLVTFAYAHCETVCPTVVRQVLTLRESARRMDIPLVVVTVDPWRDVPPRLATIAAGWGLAHDDRVLGGEIAQVNAALDAWGVGRSRDESTGDVAHAVLVVLVDREHRSATRVQGDMLQLSDLMRGA